MERQTERDQVHTVSRRWHAAYQSDQWGADKVLIGNALAALDPEVASAEDVARIIGNPTWAEPQACDECKTRSWDVVRVGEEPDYESRTTYVCGACLRRALALLAG